MRVSRRAGAEDFQRQITGAGDAMRRAGRDANGIAGYHVELIGAKCHAARALRDVINLFRAVVFVHRCYWHGHRCRLGKRQSKSNVEFWANKIATNRARDRRVRRKLTAQGWQVDVVWQCQLESGAWVDRVTRSLNARKPAALPSSNLRRGKR